MKIKNRTKIGAFFSCFLFCALFLSSVVQAGPINPPPIYNIPGGAPRLGSDSKVLSAQLPASATESVEARDFGVNGDDNIDDTSALQAAIDFAVSTFKKLVNLPAGNILLDPKPAAGVSGVCYLKDGIALRGRGPQATSLKVNPTRVTPALATGAGYFTAFYYGNNTALYDLAVDGARDEISRTGFGSVAESIVEPKTRGSQSGFICDNVWVKNVFTESSGNPREGFGISTQGTSNVTWTNIKGFDGDGTSWHIDGNLITGELADNVTVSNYEGYNNAWMGSPGIYGARKVILSNINTRNNSRNGINIEWAEDVSLIAPATSGNSSSGLNTFGRIDKLYVSNPSFSRNAINSAVDAEIRLQPGTWFEGPPQWVTAKAYKKGAYVFNGSYAYRATEAGTSGATAPTHTVIGSTASDGGVTWECMYNLQPWQSGTRYYTLNRVTYNGQTFQLSSGSGNISTVAPVNGVTGADGMLWYRVATTVLPPNGVVQNFQLDGGSLSPLSGRNHINHEGSESANSGFTTAQSFKVTSNDLKNWKIRYKFNKNDFTDAPDTLSGAVISKAAGPGYSFPGLKGSLVALGDLDTWTQAGTITIANYVGQTDEALYGARPLQITFGAQYANISVPLRTGKKYIIRSRVKPLTAGHFELLDRGKKFATTTDYSLTALTRTQEWYFTSREAGQWFEQTAFFDLDDDVPWDGRLQFQWNSTGSGQIVVDYITAEEITDTASNERVYQRHNIEAVRTSSTPSAGRYYAGDKLYNSSSPLSPGLACTATGVQSPVAWSNGVTVTQNTLWTNGGRTYLAMNSGVSTIAPTHTGDIVTLGDGIKWGWVSDTITAPTFGAFGSIISYPSANTAQNANALSLDNPSGGTETILGFALNGSTVARIAGNSSGFRFQTNGGFDFTGVTGGTAKFQMNSSGTVRLRNGYAAAVRTVTSNTTVLATDNLINVNTAAGNVTMILPAPGTVTDGQVITIKNTGANSVIISGNVDGSASPPSLSTQGQAQSYQADQTNSTWQRI